MKRVLFKRSVNGYKRGEVRDLPDREANRLAKRGLAVIRPDPPRSRRSQSPDKQQRSYSKK